MSNYLRSSSPGRPPPVHAARRGPRPSAARAVAGGVLLGLVVGLTGCVYLRLLALKGQLNEFDKYVEVHDRGDLVLVFKKPVLSAPDLLWLTKLQPTEKRGTAPEERWSWTLEKVALPNLVETEPHQLTFVTGFVSNKLTEIAIPQRFLTVVPGRGVVALFKAFGHAEILEKQRTASADLRGDQLRKELPVLTTADADRLLGWPHETQAEEAHLVWLYRYTLNTPQAADPARKLAWAKLTFDRETQRLLQLEARFAGLGFHVKF